MLGLGLVILGSFGPWVRAFIVTVSGTEGDGVYFIIGAVLALASLWAYALKQASELRWSGRSCWVLASRCIAGGSSTRSKTKRRPNCSGRVRGRGTLWGLYATLIGGVVVAGHCLYLAFRGSRASAPRADAQTAELPPIAPESAEEAPRRRSRSRGVLIAGGVVLLLIALAGAGSAAALMLRDSNKTEVAPHGPSEPVAVTSEPASGVESTDRGTTASPSPVEHVEYKTYVPSDEGYYYAAQIPSGPDWSDPSESFPTGGALLRTTVNGPNGSTLVIDRTPYEVPQLGGSYETREPSRTRRSATRPSMSSRRASRSRNATASRASTTWSRTARVAAGRARLGARLQQGEADCPQGHGVGQPRRRVAARRSPRRRRRIPASGSGIHASLPTRKPRYGGFSSRRGQGPGGRRAFT